MRPKNMYAAIAFLLLALPPGLHAILPDTLNYQGRMTTATGPVPDSTGNTVIFRIFNAPTGGIEMWAEEYSAAKARFVSTKSGLFNVTLGQYTAINLIFDVPYYLQVEWHNGAAYETLLPRQPLTMAPYAYRAKYLDAPVSLTSSTAATALFANNSSGGIGLVGRGQTGTAGTAFIPGGIGVLASDGGQLGALALRVQGKSIFEKDVTFTAGTTVHFNGVNVQGLSVSPAVPMTLIGAVALPDSALSVTNTGTGSGIVGYSTSPGGEIINSPLLSSPLTAGIKGYTSVTNSAGVAGYSNITYSAGAGVVGIGYLGVGGFGRPEYAGSMGGNFDSNAVNGMGVFANASQGTAGSFQGVTGVTAMSTSMAGSALYLHHDSNVGTALYSDNGLSLLTSTAPPSKSVLTVSQTSGGAGGEAIAAYNYASATAAIMGYSFDTHVPGPTGFAGYGVLGMGPVGVLGMTTLPDGIGVVASVTSTSSALFAQNNGTGQAIHAESIFGTGLDVQGVYGVSARTTATGGVAVQADSSGQMDRFALKVNGPAIFNGPGSVNFGTYVQFTGGNTVDFTGATVVGIPGASAPLNLSGNFSAPIIAGTNSGIGAGVQGSSTNNGAGVYGSSFNGYGLSGFSTNSSAIHAESYGSASPTIYANNGGGFGAIQAYSSGVTDSDTIYGQNSGMGTAVHGSSSAGGTGVKGDAVGSGDGIFGTSSSGFGVHGLSSSGNGVYAQSYGTGSSGAAVYGWNMGGTAGQFDGGAYGVNASASQPGGYGVLAQNLPATLASGGAALGIAGMVRTTYSTVTMNTATGNITNNAPAGTIFMAVASSPANPFVISNSYVDVGSTVMLTLVGTNLQYWVTIPAAGTIDINFLSNSALLLGSRINFVVINPL